MTLVPFRGYAPSNVNKDAKYSVKTNDGEWSVHLIYDLGSGVRELLTSTDHPDLVAMVNFVKRTRSGVEGGTFYINEFGQVVVPVGREHFYAGSYNNELRFDFENTTIGPSAPEGLRPGDTWPGPHVGIRYTLSASGDDIYFDRKLTATRTEKVLLSNEVGPRNAARLAVRLAGGIKPSGGRIYINEKCEFFAPLNTGRDIRYVYLGRLEDDDDWFREVDHG